MRRALLILAVFLLPKGLYAQQAMPKSVLAWHARNVRMLPMLYQVTPGSPFGGGGGGGGSSGPCALNTSQTPDTYFCGTDTLGNSFIFAEAADSTFDFAHAQQTDPAVFIHSHNQNTTQWLSFKHNGTNALLGTGTGAFLFQPAGADILAINGSSSEVVIRSNSTFGFSSTSAPGTNGIDTGFVRAAANVFGLASGDWFQQTPARSFLAADYTNATTTFSNTALSVTVITGRKYAFDMSLFIVDSTAADGVKLDFAGGTATVTNFVAHCTLTSDVGAATVQTNATTAALATVINSPTLGSTGVQLYRCAGAFEPSSSATFIVRAAQNAHTAGTLTIKRGSWLNFEDAP